jgi:hypothetical protein
MKDWKRTLRKAGRVDRENQLIDEINSLIHDWAETQTEEDLAYYEMNEMAFQEKLDIDVIANVTEDDVDATTEDEMLEFYEQNKVWFNVNFSWEDNEFANAEFTNQGGFKVHNFDLRFIPEKKLIGLKKVLEKITR